MTARRLTKAETDAAAQSARSILRDLLAHSTPRRANTPVIYVDVRSRAEMSSQMMVGLVVGGHLVDVTASVAHAIGQTVGPKGIRVRGCGFDRAEHLTQTLAFMLYADEMPEWGDPNRSAVTYLRWERWGA